MSRRRLAAGAALVLALAAIALAAVVAVVHFPRGLIALGGLALALLAGWHGVTRRGVPRMLGLATAIVVAVAVVILVVARDPVMVLAAVAAVWLSLAAARAAFRIHVTLPQAPRPRQPVLFYNPRSGGGKAER